jgi:hypothetical protein
MLVVATCVRDPWPDGSECCAGAVVGVDPPRPAGGRGGRQLATCSFFSFFVSLILNYVLSFDACRTS